jgi:hypothetical protein
VTWHAGLDLRREANTVLPQGQQLERLLLKVDFSACGWRITTEAQAQRALADIDANHDGSVEWAELAHACALRYRLMAASLSELREQARELPPAVLCAVARVPSSSSADDASSASSAAAAAGARGGSHRLRRRRDHSSKGELTAGLETLLEHSLDAGDPREATLSLLVRAGLCDWGGLGRMSVEQLHKQAAKVKVSAVRAGA